MAPVSFDAAWLLASMTVHSSLLRQSKAGAACVRRASAGPGCLKQAAQPAGRFMQGSQAPCSFLPTKPASGDSAETPLLYRLDPLCTSLGSPTEQTHRSLHLIVTATRGRYAS
jgi:hypothetical protein